MKFKQLSWNIKQYCKGRERYKERQPVAISGERKSVNPTSQKEEDSDTPGWKPQTFN